MQWMMFNSQIELLGGLKMLSKESKQVIIKQIERDVIRLHDAHNSFQDNNIEAAKKVMNQILKLERALRELRDV